MVAALNGVVFSQVYPDNSGGPVFDTDGDGTATQEDEFISVTNTSGAPVDISGYQIWSSSTGTGAPDAPQDGLFHTFPAGTVLDPDQTLFVINEITGTPAPFAQEASEGGVESGGGAPNTNFLTEGSGGGAAEAVVLLDPSTGDYIVLNMSPNDFEPTDIPGFPGTNNVGEDDVSVVQADPGAGFSYQYDPATDTFVYEEVFVPCFAAGTRIAVPGGLVPVEQLQPGDLVLTVDHGPQPLRTVLRRELDFTAGADSRHKPISFKAGSLGRGVPARTLVVSPQHRMLIRTGTGAEALAPAKALTGNGGVRVMEGCRKVSYLQLVFERHEVVFAEGAPTESFYPGAYAVNACDQAVRRELEQIFPELVTGQPIPPARRLLRVQAARYVPRIRSRSSYVEEVG